MNLENSLTQELESIKALLKPYCSTEITLENVYKQYIKVLHRFGIELLASLTSEEFSIVYHCFNKGEAQFSRDSSVSQQVLPALKAKGFIKVISSVAGATFSYRVSLFTEIADWLTQIAPFLSEEQFMASVKKMDTFASQQYSENIPFEVYQFFYSYGFAVPCHVVEQSYLPELIEYLTKENLLHRVLMVSSITPTNSDMVYQYETRLCYVLEPTDLMPMTLSFNYSMSSQGVLFNSLARVAMALMKEGMIINQDGSVHKKSFDALSKVVSNEYLLNAILRFLLESNFLEDLSKDKRFLRKKVSNQIFGFFQGQAKHVCYSIIYSNAFLSKIYETVMNYHTRYFSLSDFIFIFMRHRNISGYDEFADRTLRRDIAKSLEMLYLLGVIDKNFLNEQDLFYSVNPYFYEIHQTKNNISTKSKNAPPIEPDLKLMPNYELVFSPYALSIQDIYIVSMFADLKTLHPIMVFEMNTSSIHRGLFLGFDFDELIRVIETNAKEPPAPIILENLAGWRDQFKTGVIRREYVLSASKQVLDMLSYQTELKQYVVKRINDTYAIVTGDLVDKGVLENSYLYFKIEGSEVRIIDDRDEIV